MIKNSIEKKVINIYKENGAIYTDDHFVYTSGKHGSVYIRKDKLYPHTQTTSRICKLIALQIKDIPIDIVVGPAIGGIVLSQWTAFHLSKITKREVLSVFTEKATDNKQIFDRPQMLKRGYDLLVRGKRVLVIEDLTTTGNSVKKVVDEIKYAGGKVKLVCVLVNRNPARVNNKKMQSPFLSIAIIKADAFNEKTCPLCKKGVPINTEVGHGEEFLRKQGSKKISRRT